MHITLHEITDAVAYWVFFWNIVYVLLPPREMFKSEGYNKFVSLVGYYGSLNVRKLTTQVYGVVQDGNVTPDPNAPGPKTP
jgi:hypothetical protein